VVSSLYFLVRKERKERYMDFLQENKFITAKSKIPNTVFPKILAYILLFLSFAGLIIDHRFKL